ncbi:hypothetical protein [Burkholderia cepacia]|uniref:hypothetical protein n=1 Tax=Burkholderia cepacia TaxID=292 RepID=UPI001296B52C|nr:hypothetical protein [Burkholderia cepacia]
MSLASCKIRNRNASTGCGPKRVDRVRIGARGVCLARSRSHESSVEKGAQPCGAVFAVAATVYDIARCAARHLLLRPSYARS